MMDVENQDTVKCTSNRVVEKDFSDNVEYRKSRGWESNRILTALNKRISQNILKKYRKKYRHFSSVGALGYSIQ